MGRGMITRPIWKRPCIKLFITYFRHLEETPILARANMGLDNRLFSRGVKIWTVYFRSYWSYKNAFIWTKYVINGFIDLLKVYWPRTIIIFWYYFNILIGQEIVTWSTLKTCIDLKNHVLTWKNMYWLREIDGINQVLPDCCSI
jgi:hypothetical protein